MIVADTNIISYLFFPTSFSDSVDTLYQLDSNWTAPFLWKSEFCNVLSLYMRKDIINFEKALQILEKAESLMRNNEFDIPSTHILSLVDESTCSSYDCEFVALAQYLDTKLVTQDKKILREFSSVATSIKDYLAS